jgi:hypothetical protein
VRDTTFEKRQHEATGKHQNNLKRFLRDIQNNHERGEREKEKAKAEVERLNKVVGCASATTGAASEPAKPTTVRKTPAARLSAEDQKRQWAQLAQMGIDVPDNFRAEMAMAGEWKSVPQAKMQENEPVTDSLSVGVRKRKLDEEDEEDVESGTALSARKVWGKSIRTYPGDETQQQDLDSLLSGTISLKKDQLDQHVKQEPTAEARAPFSPGPVDPASGASTASRVNTVVAKQEPSDDSTTRVKSEAVGGDAGGASLQKISVDAPIPVFKKRKAKAPVAT